MGPQRLGKYEMIARIGKGGMAQVYLARQRGPANFEKVVVVKIIHPHLAARESFIEMLLDEARIAALLKHPCVVDIYDLGLEDDTYFIAMEYLSGEPLLSVLRAGRVKNRPLDVYCTARIIADVADGLHAAHELRDNAGHHLELVHRDVTPGNIVVLNSGQVKIVDFGIAKARGRLASETDARKLKGKLGYVSPEQIRGESADRRADIFALGVVMWEALTYRRLFRGSNPGTVLAAIVKEKLHPPSSVRPEVPPALDAICMRALARKPDERYPTAQEMHAELEAFLTGAGASLQRKAIASYMAEVFAEQIQERARILREMHESGAAAGPTDATSAFAAPPVVGDDDEDSGANRQEDTADDLMGGEAAPEAADQRALAPAPLTPGDGLAAAAITPAGLLPRAPTGEPDGRASSLTVGSSGELALRRPPVDAYAGAALRRQRWRIAAVAGAVVALLAILAALQESPPSQPGAGQSSDRLFAAGSGPEPTDEPASTVIAPAVVTEQAPPPSTTPTRRTTPTRSTTPARSTAPTTPKNANPDPTAAVSAPAAVTPEAAGASAPDVVFEIHSDTEEVAASEEAAALARRRKNGRRVDSSTEHPATTQTSSERPQTTVRTPPRNDPAAQKRAEALYQEGVSRFVRGELLAAQRKFREALELAPSYAPVYRGMGMIHQQSGQRKQAARAYRHYLRLAPHARDRAEVEARLQQVGD